MNSSTSKYPKFNNPEIYLRGRETKSLSSRIKRLLENRLIGKILRYAPGIQTVCDAPSGPGRLFSLWSSMGYRVIGVDISRSMVQHARVCHEQHNLAGEVVEGDIFRLGELLGETPDLVACVRFAYYFRSDRRLLLLQALSRATRKYILLQYKTNESRKGRRNQNPLSRRVNRRSHLQWHFASTHEIKHELSLANLRPLQIQKIGMFSDRIFVLAEKQSA